MKHCVGEIVDVYDGDFIGWTTAKLVEKVRECGGYERWRMVTREGSELRRLVGFDEKHREKDKSLYQPVLFKRNKNSMWEDGIVVINNSGEAILDNDKEAVRQVYQYKSNWF